MNKEELQQQLQELEEKAKQIREKLDKPEELQPLDYTTVSEGAFIINVFGYIETNRRVYNSKPRCSKTAKGAAIIAKQHRWQALMQSLRDSLGCGEYSFTADRTNWEVFYCHNTPQWDKGSVTFLESSGTFYFPTEKDAQKVVNYLNEHYPEGFK